MRSAQRREGDFFRPGHYALQVAFVFDRSKTLRVKLPIDDISVPVRLLWHSSYDRDECHNWVRDEIATLAREGRRAA